MKATECVKDIRVYIRDKNSLVRNMLLSSLAEYDTDDIATSGCAYMPGTTSPVCILSSNITARKK
jgi:hypothetical protein